MLVVDRESQFHRSDLVNSNSSDVTAGHVVQASESQSHHPDLVNFNADDGIPVNGTLLLLSQPHPSQPDQFQRPGLRHVLRARALVAIPPFPSWSIPTLILRIYRFDSSKVAIPPTHPGQFQRQLRAAWEGETIGIESQSHQPDLVNSNGVGEGRVLRGRSQVAIPPSYPGQFQHLCNPLLGLLHNEVAIPPSRPGQFQPPRGESRSPLLHG